MKKINWLNLFLELIMVVIGILLAFALNSYNENRKERKLTQQQLAGIRMEIEENLKEVSNKLIYHLDLMKQMRTNPENIIMQLKAPILKDYAWQMAKSNAFRNHVDYELYKKLLEIYQNQEILKKIALNHGEMMTYINVIGPLHLLNVDKESEAYESYKKTNKTRWYHPFEDLTYFEETLQKHYQDFLEIDEK